MESSELDGNARTDTDERRQSSLVESGGAFVLVDGRCGVEGARVLCCGLEADLDNIKGLT